MSNELAGKVAIVTGGASGIGRATVRVAERWRCGGGSTTAMRLGSKVWSRRAAELVGRR